MLTLVIIMLALFAAAFFAGTETAFVALFSSRAQKLAEWWRKRPESLLSTTLLGTNIAHIIAASLAAEFAIEHFGENSELAVTLLISAISLVFTEAIPKGLGLKFSRNWSQYSALPLLLFYVVSYPINFIITLLSKTVARGFALFAKENHADTNEMRDYLAYPIEGFDSAKLLTMDIFLRFASRKVFEIMQPRNFSAEIELGEQCAKAQELLRAGAPYVLVRYSNENIGVLDARLSAILDPLSAISASDCSRVFLPEHKDAASFLRDSAENYFAPAAVVDEHGDVVGFVGGTPFLEHLSRTKFPRVTDPATDEPIVISATTPLSKLETMLETSFPTGNYATVAGFLLAQLRRIPKQGEKLYFDDHEFQILFADERRILKVRISKSHNTN